MRALIRSIFSTLLLGCMAWGAPAMAHDTGSAPDSIRHVMMTQFDKPSDPLSVEPVVVSGDYAVAGWVQAGRGGRAVLRQEHGHWNIMVCGGDGLKSAVALAQTGMSSDTAQALAKALATAEASLSPAVLKKFSSFEGIVAVGAGQAAHHAKP